MNYVHHDLNFEFLKNFTKLRFLDLHLNTNSINFKNINMIKHLKNLEKLTPIKGSEDRNEVPHKLDFLTNLHNLEKLTIKPLSKDLDLSGIHNLQNLTDFIINALPPSYSI